MRPRATTDEATPSATSVMTANLVRLWRLTGNELWRADADAILAASGTTVANNLFASAALLSALDLRLDAVDVVIVGRDPEAVRDLLTAARRGATPNIILSFHENAAELPSHHPAAGKTMVEGRATAYVCRGETCSLPVTEASALADMLA